MNSEIIDACVDYRLTRYLYKRIRILRYQLGYISHDEVMKLLFHDHCHNPLTLLIKSRNIQFRHLEYFLPYANANYTEDTYRGNLLFLMLMHKPKEKFCQKLLDSGATVINIIFDAFPIMVDQRCYDYRFQKWFVAKIKKEFEKYGKDINYYPKGEMPLIIDPFLCTKSLMQRSAVDWAKALMAEGADPGIIVDGKYCYQYLPRRIIQEKPEPWDSFFWRYDWYINQGKLPKPGQ